MKKVLFLQNKGNSCGGVWFVTKTIGEELIKNGYEVEVLSVRDSHSNLKLEHDPKLKVTIENYKDKWEITRLCDIIKALKTKKIFLALQLIIKKANDEYKLKKDFRKIRKHIIDKDFDYIITTHYQLLDIIPKKYLTRTIHEQHTSFDRIQDHKATINTFNKYKDKITFVWLSKATCNDAIKAGYKNSTYIYNPVRFTTKRTAQVDKNKKLITIARINEIKRIDLMIKIVDEILKKEKFKNWILEIYGEGELKEKLMQLPYDKNKIKFMGITSSPEKELLNASINLNTSSTEGFAMVILEANECGIPTITFNFGETVEEEIIQGETGFFVEQDNLEEYKTKLEELMNNNNHLKKISKNCKEFSKRFHIQSVIKEWLDLFNNLY